MAGVASTMSAPFARTWAHNLAEGNHTVPCRPLGELIRFAGLRRIHFFSLDVEGAELDVLRSMDWAVPVHVWTVELDGTNPTKDAKVRALLRSHGYVSRGLVPHPKQRLNELFVHGALAETADARTQMCRACLVGPPPRSNLPRGHDVKADDAIMRAARSGRDLCYRDYVYGLPAANSRTKRRDRSAERRRARP